MLNKIKLALDRQISKKTAVELRKAGYEVVFHANHEPDEVWIPAALDQGANLFVSPDLDIPNYLDRTDTGAAWVDVPQGLGGRSQFSYLLQQIWRILRNQIIARPSYKIVEMGKYQYVVKQDEVDYFLTLASEELRLANCRWRVKGNSITLGGKNGS
jgi:hypothetical protein